ncbi:MAG: DUF6281 family protein [Streptosporangiaceae bacterium]
MIRARETGTALALAAVALAALAALAAAGCASSGGSTGSGGTTGGSGSCAAVLTFRHETYMGTSLRTHPPYNRLGIIPRAHRHDIGVAVLPACTDTNHPESQDTPVPVQVASIDGVSPTIAVAVLPRGNVYVAQGARVPGRLQKARWVRWVSS